MPPPPAASDPPCACREVLLVARWLDADLRAWLRLCHPAVTTNGWRWTIVAPDEPALARLQDELPGASFVGVPREGQEFSLWRALRPLITSGRFAAVQALDLPSAGHASLACYGSGTPLVASLRRPLDESRYSGLVGSFERWLLGRALASATAIMTGGEDAEESLLRVFPNLRAAGSRIHTIPQGIDSRPYERDDLIPGLPLRRELELDDETLLLGFLGPLAADTGLALLLDAVARLVRYGGVPDFHLACFGDDPRGAAAAPIELLGLGGHVTLHDAADELPVVLEQLDLVVLPTARTFSPRVAMEALCAGVPVLGTSCLGLREVLRGSPARLVQPGVVAALETGLRQALSAPWFEEAAAYAPAACRRFDGRAGAAQLVRLYDQLAIALGAFRPQTPGGAAPAAGYALAAGG